MQNFITDTEFWSSLSLSLSMYLSIFMDFFMSHFQLNIRKGKNLLNETHVIAATVNHKQNKKTKYSVANA